jgi:hypothetical protein
MIELLVGHDFAGAAELRAQLAEAMVTVECKAGPCIWIRTHPVGRAPVTKRVPVEAEADGGLHVLLHVSDGRLAALEFFNEDGAPIGKVPSLSQIRVVRTNPDRL